MRLGSKNRTLLAALALLLCAFLLWWGKAPPSKPIPPPKQPLRILRAATPAPTHHDHTHTPQPRAAPPRKQNKTWQRQFKKSLRALDRELLKGSEVWGRFPDGAYLMALRPVSAANQRSHTERPKGYRLWRVTPQGNMAPLPLDREIGSARIDPKHGRVAAITPSQELHLSGPQGQGPFAHIAKEISYFPTWDKEGKRLAFSQKVDMINQSLQVYDTQRKKMRTILTQEPGLAQPIWSPQGDAVIYISTRTGLASLWKLRLTQTTPLQITNRGLTLGQSLSSNFVPPPHLGRQSWEGRWLVFDSGDAFWAVHEDGLAHKKLATVSPLRFRWLSPGRVIAWTIPPNQEVQAMLPSLP